MKKLTFSLLMLMTLAACTTAKTKTGDENQKDAEARRALHMVRGELR